MHLRCGIALHVCHLVAYNLRTYGFCVPVCHLPSRGLKDGVPALLAVLSKKKEISKMLFLEISKFSIFNIKLFFQNGITFCKINLIQIFQKKTLHFIV